MLDMLIREYKKLMARTVMITVVEKSTRRNLPFDSMVKKVNEE